MHEWINEGPAVPARDPANPPGGERSTCPQREEKTPWTGVSRAGEEMPISTSGEVMIRKATRMANRTTLKLGIDLAYETGVHIGDGNLFRLENRMYRITYSGSLINERSYYRIVLMPIIVRLYGVQPRYYERRHDNTVLLVVNSKWVFEFKKNVLGLPEGKKTGIRIPDIMWSNSALLLACLQGIGDTDFCLSFKKDRRGRYKEPRLELFSNSPLLVDDISCILQMLGISFALEESERRRFHEYRLRIYGVKNLKIWLKKVGFRNPYKLAKLYVWHKLGHVPPRLSYQDYIALLR